jgi:hypothetical protein
MFLTIRYCRELLDPAGARGFTALFRDVLTAYPSLGHNHGVGVRRSRLQRRAKVHLPYKATLLPPRESRTLGPRREPPKSAALDEKRGAQADA